MDHADRDGAGSDPVRNCQPAPVTASDPAAVRLEVVPSPLRIALSWPGATRMTLPVAGMASSVACT